MNYWKEQKWILIVEAGKWKWESENRIREKLESERGYSTPWRQMMPYRMQSCKTSCVCVCARVCACVCVFAPCLQCAIDALCRPTTVPYIAFRAASMINSLTVSLPYLTLSWQLDCILHPSHPATNTHIPPHTAATTNIQQQRCKDIETTCNNCKPTAWLFLNCCYTKLWWCSWRKCNKIWIVHHLLYTKYIWSLLIFRSHTLVA